MMWSLIATAQHESHIIKGQVWSQQNNKTEALAGAFVHWQDNETGIFTNADGTFELEHHHQAPYLVVSFASYESDTIHITKMDSFYTITLSDASQLAGAVVLGRRITYGLSKLDPRTTVLLSEREFQKAACCNLSESFENAPAIDVSFADAVTGTKQIKMLGLDGFYTLIGREYMPAVRTTNSYYGLSLIPAAWVEGIQITKGAGSVVNGFESIAGQINIEMKKPFGKDNFLLDQFISEGGRAETDFMYRKDINKYVATSVFARVAINPLLNDRNDDGFLDNPTDNQFQVMNRWQFATNKGIEGIATISYNDDKKQAGQTLYQTDQLNGYGVDLNTRQFDVISKVGKVFADKPYKSFGSQISYNNSVFAGTYGSLTNFKAYETKSSAFYANLLYQSIIGNTFHQFQTGLSLQSDNIEEQFQEVYFKRIETVPGAFFEYTYKPKETFSLVGGIRADYNLIYGLSVTPRIHGKYRFNKDKTAIRISAGTGRRTSNPLAQNQQIFPSSRSLVFIPTNLSLPYGLEQEVAINSGLSFEHEFRLTYMPATIGLDYFNTTFLQEVVVDRETAGLAKFYNMENGTRANSFQAQLDLIPARRTEIRLAYRRFDVQTKYDFATLAKPFVSKDRAFINVTQRTRNKWQFSTTATWYGPQRIAGVTPESMPSNVVVYNTNYSPNFVLWNGQISKTFKNSFEVYVGVENSLNYKQENPIQDAANPFDSNFDAGLVWGPVFGRMTYGGFRWRFSSNKE